jgi:hypothetical protein
MKANSVPELRSERPQILKIVDQAKVAINPRTAVRPRGGRVFHRIRRVPQWIERAIARELCDNPAVEVQITEDVWQIIVSEKVKVNTNRA